MVLRCDVCDVALKEDHLHGVFECPECEFAMTFELVGVILRSHLPWLKMEDRFKKKLEVDLHNSWKMAERINP